METFSTKLSRRSRLLRLAGTLLTVGLLIYLLSQQGWSEIMAALKQISPWRLALAFVLTIISRFAVAARWHVLLRSSDNPATYRQALRLTFAGLFATNFLPTTIGGDLVRLVGLIRLNYSPAISAASLVVDRLVGMAGMAMTLPFGLPALADLRSISGGLLHPASALAVMPASGWVQKMIRKAQAALQQLYKALGLWVGKPGVLLASLAFSALHMICVFSLLQILLAGMGQQMSFWLIAGLYSLVYFITLLPISVNGYGLQEISMTMIFMNLGRAPLSAGLAAALLFRTLMIAASLPGALFLLDIISATKKSPPASA